jgi:hypothetical protein
MTKQRFVFLIMWALISVLFFFVLEKDGAPEWAKDIEVLFGCGVFLILLN